MTVRSATVARNTLATQIEVSINLDGSGKFQSETGVPFLDHMMEQIARHGLFDLQIQAKGDLHIDAHHTVEDVGRLRPSGERRLPTIAALAPKLESLFRDL